ncbi:uncharacterized protein LOC111328745 [Stylophora pistillata]|uniref:uncharacterized protein LOC111328745 n=1 Tax=Stylophora pistillata TaxID=50429 RepID=UPI000C046003|nr:uncharacterized protein LOC111328745 [Stylophora pistillata]XP_022788970.1 uncharacterized protein LOC111328745 [Stylophora pistillata]XP_022788971.1 uncharacterized protein LOC111328745 [Stylophora pistillata]XP_022788972.1 uncharacterized protein LOC111328745 [Stylophora pistillata]XP_022788973.1 uncharacterized protein LOC111328745 [Stylophora pistillata]XP_022788974.1 uncharacterized protein LOC111328745 [Stylophora pistillata]
MNWNTPGAEAFPPKVLNFYRLVFFVVHILPQVMQEVWKKLMDLSLTFHSFDAAQAVRDVGPVKNGTVIHLERDCVSLFKAILNTKVHAQPNKSGELSSLHELYVKPCSGKFHDSIQSPTGNKAETVALVVDQLRLLQNAICREAETEMVDEDKFDYLITLARDAFKALDLDVSLIDKFVKLSEEDFPSEKCKQLQERLKAESYYAGQIKDLIVNFIEVKSEDQNETCRPNFQCICDEQHNESLLSVGSTASLNSLPASPSDARANIPDYPPKWSPSAFEEVSIELKENTDHTRTPFDASPKLLADDEGMSRNEEGLQTKEDHNEAGNVSVDDGIEKSDQEGQQSEQCNGTCPCCGRNSIVISQCNDRVNAANSLIIQLQDDVIAYQDQCPKQEDDISQLKEKLTKIEEEKQGLEAEVGRQLFLESKEKRRTEKIFQWLDEHAHEQSMLVKARGASYEGELLHGAGSIDRSEQLITSSDENGDFFGRDTFSCLEGNLGDEGPDRSLNEADETFDELEEFGESSETSVCNYSNGNTYNNGSDFTSSNLNANDLPDSNSVTGISNSRLSTESCDSVSSLSQSSINSADNALPSTGDTCSITTTLNFDQAGKAWESSGKNVFDVMSSGMENQERSLSSFIANKDFESEEVKSGCAANCAREREDLTSFNGFCNGDLVDGPVSIPNRTQGSLKQVAVPSANQGPLPHRDTTQNQNLSGAVTAHQIDTVIIQGDCYSSNQSNKWEHSGARPRDRPPKGNRSLEPTSLYSSLVDLVPRQVSGVANAFLARHSEDKDLHESLYYNDAERMLGEEVSLQGANSYIGGMSNLANLNRAKLYPGDCQVVPRPDPTYYPSYSSVFPLTGGASIRGNGEDGNLLLNSIFNCNSVLLPGSLYSYVGGNTSTTQTDMSTNYVANDFALDTREPQLLQDEQFSSLHRSDILLSGLTGSRLTSDVTGITRTQMTHSVLGTQNNLGLTGTTSILPSESLQMQASGSAQTYGNQPNASTVVLTSSLAARADGSDSILLSGLEPGRSTNMSPVSSIRNGVNTSGQRIVNNALNTVGGHLASGTYREGNSNGSSSDSCLTSGANIGGDQDQHSGQSEGSAPNRNYGIESAESTDNSLLELEQRVEEA